MFLLRKPEEISNREMEPGETLFQYLKRKKQIALREYVEKEMEKRESRQVENESMATTYINEKQLEQKTAINSARSSGMSTKRRQRKSSSKKKKLVDSSIESNKNSKKEKENNFSLMNVMDNDIFKDDKTTRRTVLHSRDSKQMSINIERKKLVNDEEEIEENNKSRSRSPFRSFISMISPLKNKCENNLSTSLSNTKCFQKQNINEQELHKKGSNSIKTAEFSTKKTIKEAMSKVQKHYNKQVEFEVTLKEKIREFIISTNSFLVHIEDDLSESDKNTIKKLVNLKSEMKVLNSFIQSQSREEENNQISNLIESLYEQINQTLNEYEGQVNKNSLSNCQQSIEKMKSEYEHKIEELNKEKTRLGREISLVNKDHGKVVRDYDKLLNKYNELVEESEKIKKIQKSEEHEVKELYEEEINKLTEENNTLSESIKSLTRQLKNTEHNFEEYKIKVETERTEKTTAREAYLLKEISALKEECASDIENINTYYLSKLEFYPGKIKALEETIDGQKSKIFQLTEKLAESNERIRNEDKEKKEIRVKLESSLVDMCKMNEELFKHWLALKDIKTLSLRLGMFDKFERIYRDIPFDDRMFLL